MRNLIAFNFFLFLVVAAGGLIGCTAQIEKNPKNQSANANCRTGELTTLVNIQEVGRKDQKTGEMKMTKLNPGTSVHLTDVKDGKATIYVTNDHKGNFVGGMATFDLNRVTAFSCQDT